MEGTVGVIGAGAWGTAIAKAIADKDIPVEIWSFEQEVADTINNDHMNRNYLYGVDLPKNLIADTNLERVASEKEFLILATPSLFITATVKQLLNVPCVREGKTSIGIITKGFLPGDEGPQLITSSLENYLPGFYRDNLVYISGPSHAEEVARGKITGLISASSNPKKAIKFRELLASRNLRVFSALDVIGVQTCAAVKNVIAIAFGIMDALKEFSHNFGDNTESLLLAAGLNEIQLIGKALGATHPETFTSIAGVGDLDVTCRSHYGRNRRFGREVVLDKLLRKFKNIDDLISRIDDIGYLPEGVVASKYIHQINQVHGLKLPISEKVFQILNKEVDPFRAVEDMLLI